MKSKNRTLSLIAAALMAPAAIQAQEWQEVADLYMWREQQGKALIADFNNDGRNDVYFMCNEGPHMRLNTPNNGWQGVPDMGWMGFDQMMYCNTYAIDFNCDGNLDIFVTGQNKNDISQSWVRMYVGYTSDNNKAGDHAAWNPEGRCWYDRKEMEQGAYGFDMIGRGPRGDGDEASVYRPYLNSAAFGDYDHDGYPDLLMTGRDRATGANCIRLYHNDAGQGFTEAKIFDTFDGRIRYMEHDIQFADLNNDGWLDIIMNGGGDRNAAIYLNDEGKAFYEVAKLVTPFNSSRNSGFALNDFNGDGYLDYVSAGYGDFNQSNYNHAWTATIFLNKGQQHANKDVIFLEGTNIHNDIAMGDWQEHMKLVVRDFNNDSKLDILKEDSQREVYYGKNATSFEFGGTNFPMAGQGVHRACYAYGDLTGNGMTDIFAVDYQYRRSKNDWYWASNIYTYVKKDADQVAAATVAPSNVYYEQDAEGITVYWEDLPNKRMGYNVIVETNDGKVFATLPVRLEDGHPSASENRHSAIRPFVGTKGYKLYGIDNIKRVGVQTLRMYNEGYSPIAWAE